MLDFITDEVLGGHWYLAFYYAGVFALVALTLYARVRSNEQRRREGQDISNDFGYVLWAAALIVAPVLVALIPESPRLPSTTTLVIGALIGVGISAFTAYLSKRWRPE